jgi:hypothetical protein
MKMDERMRLCWLLANRMTLMVVGLVWLGMIAWELFHNRVPYFLIAMVPAFALIRLGFYHLYARRNSPVTAD